MASSSTRTEFLRRTVLVVLVVAVAILSVALLWRLSGVVLLVFGGCLFGVVLVRLSTWVVNHTRLSYRWSLASVVLTLLVIIGLGAWLMSVRVADQVNQLVVQLPHAIEQVRTWILRQPWAQHLLGSSARGGALPSAGEVVRGTTGAALATLDVLGAALAIFFIVRRPAPQ